MRHPALDVRGAANDLLYAALDDHSPTAIEERDDSTRAFFTTAAARDEAARALGTQFDTSPIDVDDEDWARRSQANLQPVTVGRVLVVPSETWRPPSGGPSIVITIPPSMAFGTGHHATTRLCLAALQDVDLTGKTVVDVGTGSGVLAIAASRLGAAQALGIDCDPDAIQAARENLALNPAANVTMSLADLTGAALPRADVVVANLTGALLVRSAAALAAALPAGGTLIVSGLMAAERDEVRAAFAALNLVAERHEDEWVALVVKKS